MFWMFLYQRWNLINNCTKKCHKTPWLYVQHGEHRHIDTNNSVIKQRWAIMKWTAGDRRENRHHKDDEIAARENTAHLNASWPQSWAECLLIAIKAVKKKASQCWREHHSVAQRMVDHNFNIHLPVYISLTYPLLCLTPPYRNTHAHRIMWLIYVTESGKTVAERPWLGGNSWGGKLFSELLWQVLAGSPNSPPPGGWQAHILYPWPDWGL